MDAEGFAIHSVNQLQVRVGTIGKVPAHHLDREAGAGRLDGIDDVVAVVYRRLKELFGQVLRIRSVPSVWIERSGDIDAAARTHGFSQRTSFDYVFKVLPAFLSIRIEHVFPCSHLGDGNVLVRVRLLDRVQQVRVLKRGDLR